jgi:hypothetical protein
MNIPLDRAHRTVSGTQHFIVGTRDWTNRFEKNSNQSLTSLTCPITDICPLNDELRCKIYHKDDSFH